MDRIISGGDRINGVVLDPASHMMASGALNPGPDSAVQPARKRPPRPAIKDAEGLDLRPDPRQVSTAIDLVAVLVQFHQWAGEPSYRTMAEQCAQMVSASTLHRALTRTAFPSFEAVQAVIIGCGGSEQDQRRFASAWRIVRSGRRHAVASSAAPALRSVPAAKTG